MEYDNKFNEFSQIVLREASEEKQRILADIKRQITESNKKIKDEILKKSEQNLKLETEKVVYEKNKKLSKLAIEAKKEVIQKREELLLQMYNTLEQRLMEFTNSDKYNDWIISKITEAQSQLNTKDITIYISKKDENLISQRLKLKTLLDNEIRIGGCKVICEQKKVLIDNTLEKKLNEVFENFDKLSIQ